MTKITVATRRAVVIVAAVVGALVAVALLAVPARRTPNLQVQERVEAAYVTNFHQRCSADVAKFASYGCPTDVQSPTSFFAKWSCLERAEDAGETLASACQQYMHGSSAKSPNVDMFVPVISNSEFTIGYVKAPLFFQSPEDSPVFKTFYAILYASDDVSEGLLVEHLGGPQAGISYCNTINLCRALFSIIGAGTHPAAFKFDNVHTDLRGFGLSSVEALFGVEVTADNIWDWMQLDDSFTKPFNTSDDATHRPRCADLRDKRPSQPEDYTLASQVSEWLKARFAFANECAHRFDFQDQYGNVHNLLQYFGTLASSYDLELLRMATGSKPMRLIGYSYGTRYAASYAGAFPRKLTSVAVSGTVNPVADNAVMSAFTAANTQNIYAFVMNSCRANPGTCTPHRADGKTAEDMADALYSMSLDDSAGFQAQCCGKVTQSKLAGLLRGFMVGEQEVNKEFGIASGSLYQNRTWPLGFILMPALIEYLYDNPCALVNANDELQMDTPSIDDLSTFDVMPALDGVGRKSLKQMVDLYVQTATVNPIGVDMASQYMQAMFGWPMQPNPIPFSAEGVPIVIANTLYDERTSIENAQVYRSFFGSSVLINAQGGGHCVGSENGAECFELMLNSLLLGTQVQDGHVCRMLAPLDFAWGRQLFLKSPMKQLLDTRSASVCT